MNMGTLSFFEARRALRLFRDLRELSLGYWKEKPPDERSEVEVIQGVKAKETRETRVLRQRFNTLFIEANRTALQLGVNTKAQSIPPAAVGGPHIPVNILLSVVDQNRGYSYISRQEILDLIDRCIGAAATAQRNTLRRLVNPLYWVIDLPALVIRLPFLILRRAGLPSAIEENIVSQVVKALLLILVFLVAAYLGIRKELPTLIDFLKP